MDDHFLKKITTEMRFDKTKKSRKRRSANLFNSKVWAKTSFC